MEVPSALLAAGRLAWMPARRLLLDLLRRLLWLGLLLLTPLLHLRLRPRLGTKLRPRLLRLTPLLHLRLRPRLGTELWPRLLRRALLHLGLRPRLPGQAPLLYLRLRLRLRMELRLLWPGHLHVRILLLELTLRILVRLVGLEVPLNVGLAARGSATGIRKLSEIPVPDIRVRRTGTLLARPGDRGLAGRLTLVARYLLLIAAGRGGRAIDVRQLAELALPLAGLVLLARALAGN